MIAQRTAIAMLRVETRSATRAPPGPFGKRPWKAKDRLKSIFSNKINNLLIISLEPVLWYLDSVIFGSDLEC